MSSTKRKKKLNPLHQPTSCFYLTSVPTVSLGKSSSHSNSIPNTKSVWPHMCHRERTLLWPLVSCLSRPDSALSSSLHKPALNLTDTASNCFWKHTRVCWLKPLVTALGNTGTHLPQAIPCPYSLLFLQGSTNKPFPTHSSEQQRMCLPQKQRPIQTLAPPRGHQCLVPLALLPSLGGSPLLHWCRAKRKHGQEQPPVFFPAAGRSSRERKATWAKSLSVFLINSSCHRIEAVSNLSLFRTPPSVFLLVQISHQARTLPRHFLSLVKCQRVSGPSVLSLAGQPLSEPCSFSFCQQPSWQKELQALPDNSGLVPLFPCPCHAASMAQSQHR